MIRVVYTWRVSEVNAAQFRAIWARTTNAIHNATPGARGSMLLQSQQDPTTFVTIARWDTFEAWQAFWEGTAHTDMQEMHALAERIAAEAYEEIEDYTR
jgi:heme-degrading monooxygenase HmoA